MVDALRKTASTPITSAPQIETNKPPPLKAKNTVSAQEPTNLQPATSMVQSGKANSLTNQGSRLMGANSLYGVFARGPHVDAADFKPLKSITSGNLLGDEVRLTIQDGKADEPATVTGIIVGPAADGGWNVFLPATNEQVELKMKYGRFLQANGNKVTDPQHRPTGTQWKKMPNHDLWGKTSFKEHLHQFIQKNPGPVVMRAIIDGQPTMLMGNASVVKRSPDYEVLQIQSGDQTHQLDIDMLERREVSLSRVDGDLSLVSSSSEIQKVDTGIEARRAMVDGLLSDIDQTHTPPFENPKLYDYLGARPDDVKALVQRWYPEEGAALLDQMQSALGSAHLPLLADPGVAGRVDQLLAFVQESGIDPASVPSHELRQKFAASLGTRKVFRGMMLTPAARDDIQTNGVKSPLLRDRDRAQQALTEHFDPHEKPSMKRYSKESFGFEINEKLSSGKHQNIFMSVTEYRSVAASAGAEYPNGTADGASLRMLQMDELPVISILDGGDGMFNITKHHGQGWMVTPEGVLDLKKDYTPVESFVPLYIGPDHLQVYDDVAVRTRITDNASEIDRRNIISPPRAQS